MEPWLQSWVVHPANSLPAFRSHFAPLFTMFETMLIKKYVLFVLVGGENIFHGVGGHKASQILCDEDRKCEPLKLFKRSPCLSWPQDKTRLVSTYPHGTRLRAKGKWFVSGCWGHRGHKLKKNTKLSFLFVCFIKICTCNHLPQPDHIFLFLSCKLQMSSKRCSLPIKSAFE